MRKLSLLLMGILLLASMLYAKDPEKQTPVYDIMKPMKITGTAKGVDASAKNEAVYNAKLKMAKMVVNSFVDTKTANTYAKQIQYNIYSKMDKYIKNVTEVNNSYVVDKKKKTSSIVINAKVNVTEIVDELDDIDGLKIIEPCFLVKISGFDDILDYSTIFKYEKEMVNELNGLDDLQARTVEDLGIERYVNQDMTQNILDECKKNKVKMVVGIGPLDSDKAALLGIHSSVVDIEIVSISTKTGKMFDYIDGLTGSHTNIFSSKKNEAEKALKKCLNNLYDYHKDEYKYFLLNSWVDIQNEK